jgi:uncharacterized RDD family membrane protein YckC
VVVRAFLPEAAYGIRPAETATAVGVAVIYLLYDTFQHALWGRTIGKRLAGIKVVSAAHRTGRPGEGEGASDRVGLSRVLLRAAVFALPIAARPVPVLGLIAGIFWVANAAWVLESARRQALHDRLAATKVVHAGDTVVVRPTQS